MRQISDPLRLLCLLLPLHAGAQEYTFHTSVPVTIASKPLLNPWAGGINSGQYNTMDVDGDGKDDLVVFDRTAATVKVFTATEEGYRYNPQAARLFPGNMTSWMLLRDFNCDGKKDIFTSNPQGIHVYVNESDPEGFKWRTFNQRGVNSPLLTKGFSDTPVNLQMNSADIPAIDDVDNDGDLDILVFRPFSSTTVEYHKNLSMERTGTCDSLQLERVTEAWGDFEECDCQAFAFNGEPCPVGGRTGHQSGKSILTIDMDGDGDRELVVGEESCRQPAMLINDGSPAEADFNTYTALYPNATNPLNGVPFPAGYYEDVDADGIKDLIMAPNVAGSTASNVDFKQSSFWYKNTGTNAAPDFEFVQPDFLQSGMIDLGENAAPAFYDYDNDGDLDMFVSSLIDNPTLFNSALYLFENTGSPAEPQFQLIDDDVFSFSRAGIFNLKPEFADVDADGLVDFVFTATITSNRSTGLYYLKRMPGNFTFDLTGNFLFGPLSPRENTTLVDVDSDGRTDLLVGRSSGRVEYYRNAEGTNIFNAELVDHSFYDFDFSPFRRSTALEVADIDGNGTADLIIGGSGGEVTLFPDFLEHTEAPKAGITDFIRLDEKTIGPLSCGSRLKPVVADLFEEDRPAIVFGTGQGGLVMLRNAGAITRPAGNTVQVYPNPVRAYEPLTITSPQTTGALVVNALGQPVIETISLVADTPVRLNISHLKEGLYLLVSEADSERAIRFVVVRE